MISVPMRTKKSTSILKLEEQLKAIEETLLRKTSNSASNLNVESKRIFEQFALLGTYSERLKFWNSEIWKNNVLAIDTYNYLDDVISIFPVSNNEITLLNEKRIDIIKEDFTKSFLPLGIAHKNITFEALKIQFMEKLCAVDNKSEFINNEIARINREVISYGDLKTMNILHGRPGISGENLMNQFFQIVKDGIHPSLNDKVYNRFELVEIQLGIALGKFILFLKNELLSQKKGKKTKESKPFWKGEEFWKDKGESLMLFRRHLIEKGFIAEISEKDFNKHFKGEPFNQSIDWLNDMKLFMYLFDNMKFAINDYFLVNKQRLPSPSELSRHFTFKGEPKNAKNLTQSRSTSKDSYISSRKEIATIIGEIKNKMIF